MSIKSIAIVTTSDINRIDHTDRTSSSTGILEKLLEKNYKVLLVTTRNKLMPTDDWWVEKIPASDIFLASKDDHEWGWKSLYEALGHKWPTQGDVWSEDTRAIGIKIYNKSKHDKEWLEEPESWSVARARLKRKGNYIWASDFYFQD